MDEEPMDPPLPSGPLSELERLGLAALLDELIPVHAQAIALQNGGAHCRGCNRGYYSAEGLHRDNCPILQRHRALEEAVKRLRR